MLRLKRDRHYVRYALRSLYIRAFTIMSLFRIGRWPYHPEAAPGPHDAADHFDHFCTMLERADEAPARHAAVCMCTVVRQRLPIRQSTEDLGGSGFAGGSGALQYTKYSRKP
jgi:hypothetical protein